jgi:hypothetical protein
LNNTIRGNSINAKWLLPKESISLKHPKSILMANDIQIGVSLRDNNVIPKKRNSQDKEYWNGLIKSNNKKIKRAKLHDPTAVVSDFEGFRRVAKS